MLQNNNTYECVSAVRDNLSCQTWQKTDLKTIQFIFPLAFKSRVDEVVLTVVRRTWKGRQSSHWTQRREPWWRQKHRRGQRRQGGRSEPGHYRASAEGWTPPWRRPAPGTDETLCKAAGTGNMGLDWGTEGSKKMTCRVIQLMNRRGRDKSLDGYSQISPTEHQVSVDQTQHKSKHSRTYNRRWCCNFTLCWRMDRNPTEKQSAITKECLVVCVMSATGGIVMRRRRAKKSDCVGEKRQDHLAQQNTPKMWFQLLTE